MTYPKGNRGECMRHSRIRCGECEYVEELEEENERLRMYIAGRPDNCIICGDDFVPRFESAAGLHYCKSCEEESDD